MSEPAPHPDLVDDVRALIEAVDIVRGLATCAVAGALHGDRLTELRDQAKAWVAAHPKPLTASDEHQP